MTSYSESLSTIIDASNHMLDELLHYKKPHNLYIPLNYMLSNKGKQIRGVFALLSYQMFCGDDFNDFKDIVLAIEALHNFTLIHDDIMDNAHLRRGKSTINKKWSNNQAILSGDLLLIQSYKHLLNSKFSSLEMYNEFNHVAVQICEGQQLDLDFQFKKEIKREDYFSMIELKTAALIQLSLSIPLYSNHLSKQPLKTDLSVNHNRKIMKKIGLSLGKLFQIQDDYLDLYGKKSAIGKTVGGDILEKKKTFLYAEACRLSTVQQKKDLISIYHSEDSNKIKLVRELYMQLNMKNITLTQIKKLYLEVFSLISKLKIADHKKENLIEFIESVLNRNF